MELCLLQGFGLPAQSCRDSDCILTWRTLAAAINRTQRAGAKGLCADLPSSECIYRTFSQLNCVCSTAGVTIWDGRRLIPQVRRTHQLILSDTLLLDGPRRSGPLGADKQFMWIYGNTAPPTCIMILLRGDGIDRHPAYAVTPIGHSKWKDATPLLPYALVSDVRSTRPVTWSGSHVPVPPHLLSPTVDGPTLLDVLHGLKKYQSGV